MNLGTSLDPLHASPGGAGSEPGAAAKPDAKKNEAEEEGPITWSKFFLYIGSGISGLIFLWYFRKARYSLHQTEVLLLERWRQFPLYPPPDPPAGELNSKLDGKGLPPDLVMALSEWFVHKDLLEAGGVVRNDILELMEELGLDETHKAAKDYLHRGEGRLEEHRRYTGTGLQESITLLSLMAYPEEGNKEGKVGVLINFDEATTVLRGKLPQRGPSVVDGAKALQQLKGGGTSLAASMAATQTESAGTPSSLASSSTSSPKPIVPDAGTMHQEVDLGGDAEAELRRMEDARLASVEEGLLNRLNRQGALSPAEESRLQEVRLQRSKL